VDISVGVVTYNRKEMLKRCLQSLVENEADGFSYEIVVINNGSEDKMDEVVELYSDNPNVHFHMREGKHDIGGGRNLFLEVAQGDYLCFVDDDDVAEKDFLKYLWYIKEKYHSDISMCNAWIIQKSGMRSSKFLLKGEASFDRNQGMIELLERNYYNSSNGLKLFDRRLFNAYRYCEDCKFDDIHIMYKLFSEAGSVAVGGKQKLNVYKHETNNSAETYALTGGQLDEYIRAFEERTIFLGSKIPELKEYFKYQELSYFLSMCSKILIRQDNSLKPNFEYMIEALSRNREWFEKTEFLKPIEKINMEKLFKN
jgi:glycosyltransferase involved in cell wall biosynthesis